MEKYLDQYFDLLINTADVEVIKTFLPTIILDKTNEILDRLIKKLDGELQLATELEDVSYQVHLETVIALLRGKKEEKVEFVSNSSENTLIFSPYFLKSLKKLNDSMFYSETIKAIESLSSKEWLKNNEKNTEKYKRLNGVAAGLSEVKTSNTRLMHMPIDGDFWYVVCTLKKEGNNKKGHQENLKNIKNLGVDGIKELRKRFSCDGKIDISAFTDFALENNHDIMMELERWDGKRNEKK